MRYTLRLYAPVLVLLVMSALRALGLGLNVFVLVVLAGAMYLHIKAEKEL